MTTNYSSAIIFVKLANLLPYFNAKCSSDSALSHSPVAYDRAKALYAANRDVELMLLIRHDPSGRTFCKIKCPINPLPIRGEFEAVSLHQVIESLRREGWTIKQRLALSMFK